MIRPLAGLVEAPALLPSGALLTAPGYDRASGLLLHWQGARVEVPEAPTQDDARAAFGRLADLFADFVFQGDGAARAVAVAACVAALVTPLARHAIDGPVPGFMFDADAPNAGKTLAASVCGAVVLGRAPAVRPWCDDADEIAKTLGAVAMHAPPVALFDNVRAHVEGGALEAVLTAHDTYAARVLGASTAPEVPWRTTLYLTGNHASYSSDSARRFVHVLMRGRGAHLAAESPGEVARVFRHPDLLRHALAHRTDYLRDALTILRGHALAGRPTAGLKDTYEAWSRVVASAVCWASGADPVNARPPEGADRDRAAAREVVAAWAVALRAEAITLATVRARVAEGASSPRLRELGDALAGLVGSADLARVSTKSLGRHLMRVVGQVHPAPWGGTMRLDPRPNRNGVQEYVVTSTAPPPWSEGAPSATAAGGADFETRERFDA